MAKTSRDDLTLRLLIAAALVLAAALQLLAIDRQSLIGDAPYHLLAGDQAVRDGINVLNLEHPPLVKLVAAIPLQLEERIAPTTSVDRAIEASRRLFEDPEQVQWVRHRARAMILLVFAIPMILVCYLLGRELADHRTGCLLALAVALSFNVLPYLSVLQTDTAVGLAFMLTAWAGLRFLRQPSAGHAAALGAALGLGLAAKFSGVLLLPILIVIGVRGLIQDRSNWRGLALLGIAPLVALAVVGVTYAFANRAYDPAAGREAIRLYSQGQGTLAVDDRLHPWEDKLLAVERVSPSLAQWLVGFAGIRAQNAVGVYPSYAFGEISYQGRWWYFPAVLLVKTPLAILVATVLAAIAWRRRRSHRTLDGTLLIGTLVGIYLSTAMASSYNLGMRHLLPIMPFLLLPAVLWAARRKTRAVALILALALESLAVAPLWMSATNTWWLGSLNPTRTALSHSNFEAHQNLISLERHARSLAIPRLHVVHPGLSVAELNAYLPDAMVVQAGDEINPGWYAVNAIVEQFLPAILSARPGELRNEESWRRQAESWAPIWDQIRAGEDHGVAAGTYRLFHLTETPAPDTPPLEPPG